MSTILHQFEHNGYTTTRFLTPEKEVWDKVEHKTGVRWFFITRDYEVTHVRPRPVGRPAHRRVS